MTMRNLLLERAEDDAPALFFEDQSWTWREYVAACCERAEAFLSWRGDGPFHVGVLLENVPALDANLDEILTVEHIDVFMVTTGDLAQSMGLLSDRANPKVIAKQARTLPSCRPSPPLSFCPSAGAATR